jgi:hypothetical protein
MIESFQAVDSQSTRTPPLRLSTHSDPIQATALAARSGSWLCLDEKLADGRNLTQIRDEESRRPLRRVAYRVTVSSDGLDTLATSGPLDLGGGGAWLSNRGTPPPRVRVGRNSTREVQS